MFDVRGTGFIFDKYCGQFGKMLFDVRGTGFIFDKYCGQFGKMLCLMFVAQVSFSISIADSLERCCV